jgi:hypothetical protein
MTRRNEVARAIFHLAPQPIAYLQIPLTPARAARLARLVLRTGIPAQDLVIDLLDDTIFALDDVPPAPSFEQSTSRE